MRRFLRSFATVALAGLSVLMVAAPASAYCCKCAPKSGTSAICLTDISGSCSDILSRNSGSNPDLTTISSCESLPDTKCVSIAGGESTSAVCQQGPTAAKSYSAQVVTPKQIGTINAPQLNVPIPGLQFADNIPMYVGQKASVPFLAQYISAVYNYLLGIVVITAAVMIVYGGFKYIVSSSMEGVKSGKDIITDAVIGLLLVFGAYTILAVINPATTSLKPLLVETVKTTAWDDIEQAQLTTKLDTQSSPGTEASAISTGCPIELTNPLTQIKDKGEMLSYLPIAADPRTQEFFAKIKPYITGATFSERVQQAGSAAVACGVHLGMCGQTAGTIYALAGVVDEPRCLQPAPSTKEAYKWPICHPHENPKVTDTILTLPLPLTLKLRELVCDHQSCGSGPAENPSYCVKTQKEALEKARQMIQDVMGSDYPESWTKQLQPGDFFQVYNGNNSCGSAHSILFLGWGDGGNAKVVSGQWGKNPIYMTQCIKKGSCNGGNFLPLMRVYRPKKQ